MVSQEGSGDGGDVDVLEVVPSAGFCTPSSLVKKGRGRLIKTGKFAGLAKAKQALLDAEGRELELQAERKFLEAMAERRKAAAVFTACLTT